MRSIRHRCITTASRTGDLRLRSARHRRAADMAATPFPKDVVWDFQPVGPFLSVNAGPLEARIFQGSGHLALVGPDRAGTPAATTILFAPPVVRANSASL